jgi:uncharacterized protein with ATP-grasp and redox domains
MKAMQEVKNINNYIIYILKSSGYKNASCENDAKFESFTKLSNEITFTATAVGINETAVNEIKKSFSSRAIPPITIKKICFENDTVTVVITAETIIGTCDGQDSL